MQEQNGRFQELQNKIQYLSKLLHESERNLALSQNLATQYMKR